MGYYWNFLAEQLTLCNLYKEDFNMTKLSKKVMSLVVASSVAITSIFAGDMLGSNSAKAAETTTKTITVHFKPGYNTTKDADKLSHVQLKTKQDDIYNRAQNKNNFTEFEAEKASWYKASVEITEEEDSKKFRFKVIKANPSSTDNANGVRYFPPLKDKSASDIDNKYTYLSAINLDDNTTDYYFLGNTSDKSVTANENAKAQYDTDMNNSTATATPTATASANTTSTPAPNKTAGKVLVRYKAPDAWKNYSYVFIHYNTGETKTDGTLQWYYKPMQKINKTWFYTVNLGSADKATVQFLAYTGSSKISTSKLNNDNTNSDYIKSLKDAGATWETNNNTTSEYTVKAGTVDIDGQSHNSAQTYTANGTVTTITATPRPTATPYVVPTPKIIATVAPIKNMPYVDSDMGSNATFADGPYDDGLTLILTLKNGATRATYTVDDGPVCELTKTSAVKIGQGKIVGEPIVMNITTTDGNNTSTQTFTYTKVPNYSATNMQKTSKIAATAVPTVAPSGSYTIEFKKPSNWNLSLNQKIYLYSYCNDATTTTEPTKPNGEWPGTIMTSSDSTWYTGTIKNADANTRYIISYGSVSGTTNVANTVAQFPTQNEAGFLVGDGLKVIDGVQQTVGNNIEANSLTAYFGSTVSTPQKLGTALTLKTVCQNAVGNVSYSYFVSGYGTLNSSPNGTARMQPR